MTETLSVRALQAPIYVAPPSATQKRADDAGSFVANYEVQTHGPAATLESDLAAHIRTLHPEWHVYDSTAPLGRDDKALAVFVRCYAAEPMFGVGDIQPTVETWRAQVRVMCGRRHQSIPDALSKANAVYALLNAADGVTLNG